MEKWFIPELGKYRMSLEHLTSEHRDILGDREEEEDGRKGGKKKMGRREMSEPFV